MTFDRIRGRFLIAVFVGALVFVGLSAYGDFGKVANGLGDFRWGYLPLILGLSFTNYILRFFKWQYYLRTIGVRDFPTKTSALTYLSGLGMVVTPGKVGEWLKCFLLREIHGTPFSRTAPIIIAERLTDMLGLVILGAAGLFVVGEATFVAKLAFPVALGGIALLIGLARNRPLAYWFLHKLEELPLVARFARHAEEFYNSSYALLAPRALASMTLLSVCSWGFEVLGFYFVLIGVGEHASWDLLLKASFIMPAATLVGATIGLVTPGGLGIADASITGLCQAILHLSKSTAAVATLIIRFGTLWFGVIVGLTAIALISGQLSQATKRKIAVGEPGDLAPLPGAGEAT